MEKNQSLFVISNGLILFKFGVVLVATAVLAQEHAEESHGRQYVPQHGQAFSYSHVIHDHGSSLAHPANHDYHLPLHYPVYQPYTITAEKHIPFAFSIPVPKAYQDTVPKPYTETVAVDRPYPYPVAVSVPTLVPVAFPKPYPVLVQGQYDHQEDEGSAEYSSSEDDESR